MYGSLEKFPLRQVKFVRTRNSVLKSTMELLEDKELDDISVDEICQKSHISRGTFFNYFPQKSYIFYYYIRIFTIKLMIRIENWDEDMPFKEQMQCIYKWFNEDNKYPNFSKLYIYYLLDEGPKNNDMKLSEAEFIYFFSGIEDEEEFKYYNNLSMIDIFKDLCAKAKLKGEIPGDIDQGDMARIFLGFLLLPTVMESLLDAGDNPKELFDIIMGGKLIIS